MPGRDATGPMGLGSMTGRASGNCQTKESGISRTGYFGCENGRGRRRTFRTLVSNGETLVAEKAMLEKRIAEIDETLKK